jgi:hypothetical protein
MNRWINGLILIIWLTDLAFWDWPTHTPALLSFISLVVISMAAGIALNNLVRGN